MTARVRRLLFATLIGAAALGCSKQRNEDFVPNEETARRALESYLVAWQQGNRDVSVPNSKPAVMSGDGIQAGGRPLREFTILGPVAADAPRCFAVRLVLDGPREEVRERYVIIGLDPLWVMRYADYEMLLHWDHPMPTAKNQPNASSPGK